MRKNNRKGFTIVELIIVIAVIAILAGVLIPTFASIISKANASKALQEAQNAYKEAYALAVADGKIDAEGESHKVGSYEFIFTAKTGSTAIDDIESVDVNVLSGSDAAKDGYTVSVADGKVSVAKVGDNGATENEEYTTGAPVVTPPAEEPEVDAD